MLTFFATPKPFAGHIDLIQRNALRSWTLVHPDAEVILFGNEPGTAQVAQELGLRHAPEVRCNEHGTPFVNDLFAQAQRLARHELLCYANADIIFVNDFAPALARVQALRRRFLLVGERWDLDVTESIAFTPGWQAALAADAQRRGHAHGVGGIDYFAFTKGLWQEMPPLLVGRPRWDNWALSHARRTGLPVIDATATILAIHQNHDYAHIKVRTGPKYMGPEGDYNIGLVHPYTYLYTLDAANWLLDANGLRRARQRRHLRQRLNAWFSFRFPGLRRRLQASLLPGKQP